MTFAKCLHLNKSIKSINPAGEGFVLPRSERVPVYRRQIGSIFSVEYAGEQRSGFEDRARAPRRVCPSYLF